MAMRDECMAPNRKQRASMLRMNAVHRRINQKARLLLTLKKFAADRDRAIGPAQGSVKVGDYYKTEGFCRAGLAFQPCAL
jgi:hypothetical protein